MGPTRVTLNFPVATFKNVKKQIELIFNNRVHLTQNIQDIAEQVVRIKITEISSCQAYVLSPWNSFKTNRKGNMCCQKSILFILLCISSGTSQSPSGWSSRQRIHKALIGLPWQYRGDSLLSPLLKSKLILGLPRTDCQNTATEPETDSSKTILIHPVVNERDKVLGVQLTWVWIADAELLSVGLWGYYQLPRFLKNYKTEGK